MEAASPMVAGAMYQPNPKFRTPDDLPSAHREHYEVARSLAGWFTPSRFRQQYRQMYEERAPGSILPSDYCFNRDNKGNTNHPRFLLWDNGSQYLFVDLNGTANREERSRATVPGPNTSVESKVRSPTSAGHRGGTQSQRPLQCAADTMRKLRDPLKAFDWKGVLDRYDRFTQPRFEAALVKFSEWVPNLAQFVPIKEERRFYHQMLDMAQSVKDRDPSELSRLYAGIAFWKLYSTSPRVPRALMTDGELAAATGESLVELVRTLPGTVERNADVVARIVQAIGDWQVHGMKSAGALPMRTTFLHFLFPDVVPIYDQMVLRAVGFSTDEARQLNQNPAAFRQYLPHCWSLASRYAPKMPRGTRETPLRLIDVALWLSRGS